MPTQGSWFVAGSPLAGYRTRVESVRVGGRRLRIRGLVDRQQYDDPRGTAAALGISPTTWAYFGVLWPAARCLAEALSADPVPAGRILELGCGLALPALSLLQRGGDVTATDIHPMVKPFLLLNTHMNGLPQLPFHRGNWATDQLPIGEFDTIIASDVLYERLHPLELAAFVARHTRRRAVVLIADPGRGQLGTLRTAMAAAGYDRQERTIAWPGSGDGAARVRLLRFARGAT